MPEKLDFELSEGRPKMSSNAAVRLSAEAGSCEPYGIGVRDRLLTQTPLCQELGSTRQAALRRSTRVARGALLATDLVAVTKTTVCDQLVTAEYAVVERENTPLTDAPRTSQ